MTAVDPGALAARLSSLADGLGVVRGSVDGVVVASEKASQELRQTVGEADQTANRAANRAADAQRALEAYRAGAHDPLDEVVAAARQEAVAAADYVGQAERMVRRQRAQWETRRRRVTGQLARVEQRLAAASERDRPALEA